MSLATSQKWTFLPGAIVIVGTLVLWLLGEAALVIVLLMTPLQTQSGTGSQAQPSGQPQPASPSGSEPPPEFRVRLAQRGARSGDVQISLIWDGGNDLDLHCVGPDGYDIYSATRDSPSPTGGRMDIDANAACYAPEKTLPTVENIYWPSGSAPKGTYRVSVEGFERCPGGHDETPFRVSILANGQRLELEGTVVFSKRLGKQLVKTFEVQSIADAPTAQISGDPPQIAGGVTASPVGRPPHLQVIWTALIAPGLALVAVAANNLRGAERLLVPRRCAWVPATATLIGLGCGWSGGRLDRAVLISGNPNLGFVLSWLLLGTGLGVLVSFLAPRAPFKKAAVSGLLGGAIGAALYFPGCWGGESYGRLLAVMPLGLVLGCRVTLRGSAPQPGRASGPGVHRASSAPPPAARSASGQTPPQAAAKPVASVTPIQKAEHPVSGDACPQCGRKAPGLGGARHCIICNETY
jgi:hypothetical protein